MKTILAENLFSNVILTVYIQIALRCYNPLG